MLDDLERAILIKLIVLHATGVSVKELFCSSLEIDADLQACKKLDRAMQAQDRQTMEWLESRCLLKRVDPTIFIDEIRQFLTAFTAVPAQKRKYYEILQLSPCASKEEVKRQYRKLAQIYHPDTINPQHHSGDADHFIELTQAYHALLEEDEGELAFAVRPAHASPSATMTDNARHTAAIRTMRRKNFIWYATACLVLCLTALAGERLYNNTIMVRQLTASSGTAQQRQQSSVPSSSTSQTQKQTLSAQNNSAQPTAGEKRVGREIEHIDGDSSRQKQSDTKARTVENQRNYAADEHIRVTDAVQAVPVEIPLSENVKNPEFTVFLDFQPGEENIFSHTYFSRFPIWQRALLFDAPRSPAVYTTTQIYFRHLSINKEPFSTDFFNTSADFLYYSPSSFRINTTGQQSEPVGEVQGDAKKSDALVALNTLEIRDAQVQSEKNLPVKIVTAQNEGSKKVQAAPSVPSQAMLISNSYSSLNAGSKDNAVPPKRNVTLLKNVAAPTRAEQAQSMREDIREPTKGVPKATQVAQVEVVPQATAANQVPVVNERDIRQFLTQYITAYSNKNLFAFMHFFSSKAKENGAEMSSRWSKYKQLFAEVDSLLLIYNPTEIVISNNKAHIDGIFTLHIVYPDGKRSKGNGRMGFELSFDKKNFLIDDLQYTFNH